MKSGSQRTGLVNPKNEFFDINLAAVTEMPQCGNGSVIAPYSRDGASWNDGHVKVEIMIFRDISQRTDKMPIPGRLEPPTC